MFFVKSVYVTTTFPLIIYVLVRSFVIIFFFAFFFIFFFVLRFRKREKKEERPWNADERSISPQSVGSFPESPIQLQASSCPFVLLAPRRRRYFFPHFFPFLSVTNSFLTSQLSISIRRRLSILVIFAIDFSSSSFVWSHVSKPTPPCDGATVSPGILKSARVYMYILLFSTHVQSLSLSLSMSLFSPLSLSLSLSRHC